MKTVIVLLLSVCIFVLSSKISIDVERELSLKGNVVDIFVEFVESVDFSKTTKNGVHAEDLDEVTRGRFVLAELMGTSLASQSKVKLLLTQNNIQFSSFYVDNLIFAKDVSKDIIEQLIKIDNVKLISNNPLVDFELEKANSLNDTANGVEWNVKFVGADKVWAKGFKGKGIVVSNSDTGVAWEVPALKKTYRGNKVGKKVSHDYNWFDGSASVNSKVPIDLNGHGTHCMGTKSGEDGNNKIGMAPEAEWISCRSLGPGASRQTVLKCLEFLLAPFDLTGKNPNPDKRPHISSHSYLCGGCNLNAAVINLRASGIAVVVANGNSGPRCSSTTHPADVKESFSVGALAQNSDSLASFSSKGPFSNYVKPNIVAPGQNVRSCTPRGYQSMSGTSMAAPAVAGCIALLWDAKPNLKRKITETEKVLSETAKKQRANNQCNSDAAPNNLFGWGTIQIDQAIIKATELGY